MRSVSRRPRPAKLQPSMTRQTHSDPDARSTAQAQPVTEAPAADLVLREAVQALLAEAGLLSPPWDHADLSTTPTDVAALEQEFEAWLDSFTEPLGLAAAVDADRNE